MTFRRDTNKAFVILHSGASTADFLKAAFSAHTLLYLADAASQSSIDDGSAAVTGGSAGPSLPWLEEARVSPTSKNMKKGDSRLKGQNNALSGLASSSSKQLTESTLGDPVEEIALLRRCQAVVNASFPIFLAKAEARGWRLNQTMLNPKETRLLSLVAPPLASPLPTPQRMSITPLRV